MVLPALVLPLTASDGVFLRPMPHLIEESETVFHDVAAPDADDRPPPPLRLMACPNRWNVISRSCFNNPVDAMVPSSPDAPIGPHKVLIQLHSLRE
jgi:hypothetical protein